MMNKKDLKNRYLVPEILKLVLRLSVVHQLKSVSLFFFFVTDDSAQIS